MIFPGLIWLFGEESNYILLLLLLTLIILVSLSKSELKNAYFSLITEIGKKAPV